MLAVEVGTLTYTEICDMDSIELATLEDILRERTEKQQKA